MAKRFEGKVAVVTGAAQSVGFETAKAFINEGAKVILTGRTLSKLETAVEKIGSPNAVAFQMDVGYEEDWNRLVDFIKENYGEIDYLVNNAAIMASTPILSTSVEAYHNVVRTNMDSVFLGMKLCYPVIKKDNYSAIVNVSSVGSLKSTPMGNFDAAYCAAKAGVNLLSMNAAVEMGKDKIKVNCILPAAVNTPMRDQYLLEHPDIAAQSAKTKAIPPYCTEAAHQAQAILFCCDPACPTMTGAQIVVDAGNMLI